MCEQCHQIEEERQRLRRFAEDVASASFNLNGTDAKNALSVIKAKALKALRPSR